jgi:RNA polymerase sigma factor (sigma-70 family)
MDDATLVHDAIDGSRDAFAAIYDRYAGRLHDFLWWVLQDREEAADVLHDTFLVAGSRLHQLRDPAKLRPWLFAIARHQALRTRRRRSREEPLGDTEVTSTADEPGEAAAAAAAHREVVGLIHEAEKGLSARDRVILDLHLRQGLEGEELGDALGVGADHAYVLVHRLREQVERSLGALVVAKYGRHNCVPLDQLLSVWEGELTTIWRKRIARHIDGCEACSDFRRRRVSAAALLSIAPALALPADLRDRVLDDVQLCSHTGRPWATEPGGFPPPLEADPQRKRWLAAAVAAAVVLLLGAVVLFTIGDEASEQVASVGGSTTTSSTRVPTTPLPTVPETTVPAADPAAPGAGEVTTPTAAGGGGTAGGAAGGGGGGGSSGSGAATTVPATPPPTQPPPTAAPTTHATTTTEPPDTTPPTLSGLTVSPAVVRAGAGCANDDPRQATVTIRASDRSGIASISVTVAAPGGGSTAMTPNGDGTFSATVGPFDSVPGRADFDTKVIVQASDRAGNPPAGMTADITLRCIV